MPRSVFMAISKPHFLLTDWVEVRERFAERRNELARVASADFAGDLVHVGGEMGRVIHPCDVEAGANTPAESLEASLLKTRSLPGFGVRFKSLSHKLMQELSPLCDDVPVEVLAYGFVSEFGSINLVTMLVIDSPVSQTAAREHLTAAIHHKLSAEVDAELQAFAHRLLGLKPVLDSRAGFTYLAAFYDDAAAAKLDPQNVHRLEDGDDDNMAESLGVAGIGVSYAYAGWSHSTFIAEDISTAIYVAPAIIAADSLYQVASYQSRELVSGGHTKLGAVDGDEEFPRVATISQTISKLEKYLFNAEMLDLERRRLDEKFKPWQRGIYAHLFSYWGARDLIETFRRVLELKLNAARSALASATARLEGRQNAILAVIALLQITALASSILAFLDLYDRSVLADVERLYEGYPFFLFAVSVPIVTLVALILVLIYFFRRA